MYFDGFSRDFLLINIALNPENQIPQVLPAPFLVYRFIQIVHLILLL
jgi:hypothetical protein